MELFLVDINPELVKHWKEVFSPFPEVHVLYDDILTVADTAIVSPANCFGLMDGGIDLYYISYFGIQLENKVIERISGLSNKILQVGSALMIETGDKKIPYLIVAPTMEIPGPVNAVNSYQAMSAILKTAHKHKDLIQRVFCPGLGTGVGHVDCEDAAREMMMAYRNWKSKLAV